MGFEYDPNKSAENKRKHGIDFEEAQELGRIPDWWKFPLVRRMSRDGCWLARSNRSTGPR